MLITIYGLGVPLAFLTTSSSGTSSCIDPAEVRKTDQRYEESLVEGDVAFLDGLLAEEFVWVHTRSGRIDSKESLLQRLRSPRYGPMSKSRISEEVEVRQKGSVAVVTGFTTVERPDEFVNGAGALPLSKHRFMRTYVLVDGQCLLLAKQTARVTE